MTIDEFLSDETKVRNHWVFHPDFQCLYLRKGRGVYFRLQKPTKNELDFKETIQIANLVARNPGHGAFTKLVADLRLHYPNHCLVVENACERFSDHLRRAGWLEVQNGSVFILFEGLEK